jgi:hypothetical protein
MVRRGVSGGGDVFLPSEISNWRSSFIHVFRREDREDCRVMIVDFGFLIAGLVV